MLLERKDLPAHLASMECTDSVVVLSRVLREMEDQGEVTRLTVNKYIQTWVSVDMLAAVLWTILYNLLYLFGRNLRWKWRCRTTRKRMASSPMWNRWFSSWMTSRLRLKTKISNKRVRSQRNKKNQLRILDQQWQSRTLDRKLVWQLSKLQRTSPLPGAAGPIPCPCATWFPRCHQHDPISKSNMTSNMLHY